MRVLFVSGELIAGGLALRLKEEGCDVKLFIKDSSRRDCYDNMIDKVDDWRKELHWVGKDGLVIFDDIGYGKVQDDLRNEGYQVFGGCEYGDKMEKNRAFGQKVLKDCGIKFLETFNFDDVKSAINFIKRNPKTWVVKQNGHISSLNYVGNLKDGSDAISLLESYNKQLPKDFTVSLQEKVTGVEIGVARYFNGKDWVGPIEFNIEHKNLFDGGIGPLTGEMGTVMWYEENEKIKLYQETLAKMKPFLQKINFKGDVDINCIVDKKRIYPLEFTARLGCPSTYLQMELNKTLWKDFLLSVAKGEKIKLKYKKGVGVIVSIAIPPFPYTFVSSNFYLKNARIVFTQKLKPEEKKRLFFEEVNRKDVGGKVGLYIAGSNGFIMYVSGFGKDVSMARKQAYKLIKKVIIPKMFYRMDIGLKFEQSDKELLKQWGWIN